MKCSHDLSHTPSTERLCIELRNMADALKAKPNTVVLKTVFGEFKQYPLDKDEHPIDVGDRVIVVATGDDYVVDDIEGETVYLHLGGHRENVRDYHCRELLFWSHNWR